MLTHPNITVHIQNGIVFKLSKAKFDISHLRERTSAIHGDEFTYYSDRKQKYFLWTKGFVSWINDIANSRSRGCINDHLRR
ncbi:Protein of unknown function [Thermobacillus xylanilyticus]|uniref:Uncharacterized protein n=1 Tax=Thermobacillus xylanilyticus TaxID=76633 RepID=A0ABM8V0C2_THEXY|nr:Protein of unknown function [Thermobacillus xylanilyticus]